MYKLPATGSRGLRVRGPQVHAQGGTRGVRAGGGGRLQRFTPGGAACTVGGGRPKNGGEKGLGFFLNIYCNVTK